MIPLVATYAAALEQSGYPPELFFSRDFTIDTGQIVNQGRAKALFRGLVSLDGSWSSRNSTRVTCGRSCAAHAPGYAATPSPASTWNTATSNTAEHSTATLSDRYPA